MPFDDPSCFRLDRISVRPAYRRWRPSLVCGKPAFLDGEPGAVNLLLAARVLRPHAGAGQAALWRDRPACAARGPNAVAMVEFDLAARRPMTPMDVRPTDPCRAPWRPYGLTALKGSETEALTERATTRITDAACRLLLFLIGVDLIDHRAHGVQPAVPGGAKLDSVNRTRLIAARDAAAEAPNVFVVRPFQRLERHLALGKFVLQVGIRIAASGGGSRRRGGAAERRRGDHRNRPSRRIRLRTFERGA